MPTTDQGSEPVRKSVIVAAPDGFCAGVVRAVDTRVAYLTQTTLALDDTRDVVAAVRRRFTDVRGPGSDDICYASQNRQVAVKQITAACDVVLDDRWLDGASTVGVTAGASTPEVLVNRLLARLAERGFVDVYVHRTVSEDITFQLPASLEG